MIKFLQGKFVFFLCLFFVLTVSIVSAQQHVFTENFDTPGTPQSASYTTNGSIGTSRWNVTRSGNDFGAKIDDGMLTLTNDVSYSLNRNGWVAATTSTSNFDATYNPFLSRNAGVVSWTFNMRQLRLNPQGFEDGDYGVAFILAGTPGSNNSSGKGWAIQLGNSGSTDPIRLVAYSNGLKTFSTKLSSKTSELTDFGRDYTSIRVDYNPADNKWSLFVRKDGGMFQNPKTGTLVLQETGIYNDFINESLSTMGGYWSAGILLKQTAFFDNISVSVDTPKLTSINPNSKIAGSAAFTMTVNGTGFLPISKVQWNGQDRTTTFVSPTQLTAVIPTTDVASAGTAMVRVRNNSLFSGSLPFNIEPFIAPSLSVSKNELPGFNTTQGFASPTNTYTISGTKLTSDAKLTAPTQFEMAVNGTNPIYSNPLILPRTNEGLTGQPLIINVRVKATSTAGIYSGNISNEATGALTKLVAVSAKVLALEPTTAATAVNFTNVTSTTMTVNWTNGLGSNRIVLIKDASAVNALPVDGTSYTANPVFGTGSELGTGNFTIYNGTGSSVSVTGLNPVTKYYVSVIEFNGSGGVENYRTAGAVNNTTTLSAPAGLQIKQSNTSYKIDFDDTVEGVNMGRFEGVGIEKIAQQGQLDSDSWAFSNFSSGPIDFGGNSIDYSSYENGVSDGNVDQTGIYAFNVSENGENHTLGIKPGGVDFNPGNISLRLHNQTGGQITTLNIGYKVYIKNVENASTTVSFSHKLESAAAFSGAITAIDVVSDPIADQNPTWKASYRVITLTGLNIPADKYYNIRWSGSTSVATAAQDEFGIDDIEVIASTATIPATNTVAFDGIAEDFVLQGNASLSADLSVQNSLVFNGGKLAIKDKTLTIAGSVTNTTANGLTGGTNSKLIVRGTKNPTLNFDQTPGANVFNSFSLIGANPNTVKIANNLSVNNILKVDEQQILDLGTNTLGGTLSGGTLGAVENNGIISTQNISLAPFPANKTWAGKGVLNLNSNDPIGQTLVGGIYTNLTLSSNIEINRGTKASSDVTVNGILHLPNANASATIGSLSMGTYTLTMGPDGTNTGIGDVTGIIKRDVFVVNKLYTFGHPNSSITFPPAGTLPTSMSAKLTIGAAPSWRAGAIKRQFDIIHTDAVDTKAIIRQHYLDSELNGNVESKLVFWAHTTATPTTTFDQGRSNNNTTDNWVEISNANVGLYFKNTFDQVYITLDEGANSDLTWNGSESTNWITAANWTNTAGGSGVPSATTKVLIPNVSTGSNRYPIIDANSSVKTITIDAGAVVNTPDNSVLTVYDGAGAWQNNGTFNPGNGTVIFNNIDATISGRTTFNNLTIATGAGLRALEGNKMSIAGTFTNSGTMFTTLLPNTIEFTGSNQIIPAVGGESFGGYYNLIVSGTGAKTLAPAISTLNVRGNLTLNQELPFTGKTINLAGISDQTIGGTAAINFNDLIVNKETGAVILAKDITVGGTLTLTKGNVVLGTSNLTLGSTAVAGTPFSENNMIVADAAGLVRRPFTKIGSYFFPIGERAGALAFSPITVDIKEGSFANAFVEVNTKDEKHPNNFSLQNYIRHYWNVKQTGITGAIATITAKYETLDIFGLESEIAAAQLNGTFNAETNPWIKFGPLASNTLTAKDVTLTDGQTSVFTGLKAGAFSVEVFGYGDFCINSEVYINAVLTGGDAPFTYNWSNGLPNTAEVLLTTSVAETTNYTLTVIDANGFPATDTTIPVVIFPASIGGTVSNPSQTTCAGSMPSDLVLLGSIGKVLYWQKSTDINFGPNSETNPNNVTNLSVFTTTISGAQIGPLSATTYFRAVLQNGDCAEKFSDIATITVKSTTWDGTSWSSGIPDSLTSVIFAANYDTSAGGLTVCSFRVNKGFTLTIKKDSPITVQNDIINYGNIIVENDANLIQLNDNGKYIIDPLTTPIPTFTVKRNANIKRLDYVYWSSPVIGQNLKTFSPRTVASRFLTYNEWDDKFTSVPNIATTDFGIAKGYAIRADNNYPVWTGTAPTSAYRDFVGVFAGIPNTGIVTFPLKYQSGTIIQGSGNGHNLVGNPYPSNMKLEGPKGLFSKNTDLIEKLAYFWTNVNPNVPEGGATYSGDNYAIFNDSGGKAAANSSQVPSGIVKVGQGFVIKAKATGKDQNLVFNNEMRDAGTSTFFDRKTDESKDRFWLRLTTPGQNFTTLLIAYVPNATNGFEYSYDAPLMGMSSDALFSILEDYQLGIQGRQYPLNPADVISLGTNSYLAGDHVISLQEKEGIFANGQNIYLKDKQTNTVTNLSAGAYTFTANAGLTEGRFEIIYENDVVLGTGTAKNEELIVYKDGTDFIIKSASKKISDVEVYDTSGRLMIKLNPNQTEIRIDGQSMINGVYVLKINQNGKVTTRKIIR